MNIKTKQFRFDINGLRAWAVLSVILFHFQIPLFDGGFVGVDIFFVISGFLMVKIIVNGLEKPEGFSLFQFYLARAIRIIPALAALCMVLLILGWLILPAVEYEELGKHVFSAIVFISNGIFYLENGYFDSASHDKWLLHTWSLSVEWQFYIVLPIALIIIRKLFSSFKITILFIMAAIIISYGLSIYLAKNNTSAGFYLLPTRAWEMLIGGLVFVFSTSFKQEKIKAYKNFLETLGIVLMLGSILLMDKSITWPGSLAMIPVLGASLVLLVSNQQSWFTKTPIAQWLGNRSYSIYLWHWPIVVGLVYAELLQNRVAIIVGLFLSLLLGHISFHLIENTTRKYFQKISQIKGLIFFSLLVIFIASLGQLVKVKEGIQERIDPEVEKIFNGAIDRNPQSNCLAFGKNKTVPECQYGGEKLGVIVLGDSLSASIMHTVEKALPSKDLHVLDWSKAGCPTIKNVKKTDKSGAVDQSCGLFINYAVERLKTIDPKVPVIIYSYSSSYFIGRFSSKVEAELQKPDAFIDNHYSFRNQDFFNDITMEFEKTICEISSTRDVYLLKPTPEFYENIPYYLGRKRMLSGKIPSVKMKREDYINRNKKLLNFYDKVASNCNVHLLDPTEYLCNEGFCLADDKGVPMYYDGHHLSEHGANKLLPMFKIIAL